MLTNAYTSAVVVMFVLPQCSVGTAGCNQEDGCPNLVSQLQVVDVATSITYSLTQFGAATQGWFNLQPGQTIQLLNTNIDPNTQATSACLQGLVVGFGQFGNSCPATTSTSIPGFPNPTTGAAANPPIAIPNGTNSFEASLNLPGLINGSTTFNGTNVAQNESTDISCVNGANCTLTVTITPPTSGPYWLYNEGVLNGGTGVITFTSATNMGPNSYVNVAGSFDNNCVNPTTKLPIPGVFPYGCTQCNRLPDPAPPCAQFCAVNNGLPANTGCGFNRAPNTGHVFGGSILVTYGGPLSPPL